MNIEDILKGPQRRTKTIKINGLPDLVLTEMTAGERWQLVDEMPDSNESNALNKFVAKTVLNSLLGFSRSPDPDELDQFVSQYGHDVIDLLYSSLVDFSAIDANAVENAKKP